MLRVAQSIRWLIIDDQGSWHVERGGRTVYDGSYDECEDYVRAARGAKDTVTRIENDGYRWDLTTHLR